MTCTEEEINEFCKELPRYKRPRKIIFEHVPRNATGKIEKPLLRKMHKSENLVAAENNALICRILAIIQHRKDKKR